MKHFGTDVKPNQLCLIGDRVLTDVVMATTNGSLAVKVKPFTDEGVDEQDKAARAMEELDDFHSTFIPEDVKDIKRRVKGIDEQMMDRMLEYRSESVNPRKEPIKYVDSKADLEVLTATY